MLEGSPPSHEDWDALPARLLGWPEPDQVEALYGDFGELWAATDAAQSKVAEAWRLARDRVEQADEALTQATRASDAARRDSSRHDRVVGRRDNLERRVQAAAEKADTERGLRRVADRAAESAASERDCARQELQTARERAEQAEHAAEHARQDAERARAEARRSAPPRLPAPGLQSEGRPAYALWLTFDPAVDYADVRDGACRWVQHGALRDQLTGLGPGRHTLHTDVPGASLEALIHTDADEDRDLFQLTWRQPYEGRLSVYVIAEVTVVRVREQVTAGITLRVTRPTPRLERLHADLAPPRLAADWITSFPVTDGSVRMTAEPFDLRDSELAGLAALIANHERRRPPVLTTGDATRLARQLAGLAHVIACDPVHQIALRDALGVDVDVDSDTAAVIWPGAIPPVAARDLSVIRARSGGRGLDDRPVRAISDAAIVGLPAPESVHSLRRAAARARLAADTPKPAAGEPDSELLDALEAAWVQVEQLTAELTGAHERAEELARELEDERRQRRGDAYRTHEPAGAASEAPAQEPLADAADVWIGLADRLTELPDPADVAEAVRAAADRCSHLVFAERAFETAADSLYRDPAPDP